MNDRNPLQAYFMGRQRRTKRRGTLLVAAMVCLLVVMLMGGTLLKGSLSQHRQTRRQLEQHQASWLSRSAAERATAQLQSSADYVGETWRITATELASRHGAVIEILAPQGDQTSARRKISIEVQYGDDPLTTIRYQKEITIDLPKSGKSS